MPAACAELAAAPSPKTKSEHIAGATGGAYHAETSVEVRGTATAEIRDNTVQTTSSVGTPQRSNSLAKVTAVNLKAAEVPYDGPCGKKLRVSGDITTDGPGTVWYRFYANVGGVDFSEGQNGTITLASAGMASAGKDATFAQNKSGELRLQAAVQNPQGRHGVVTISNVVPFQVTCAEGTSAGRPR